MATIEGLLIKHYEMCVLRLSAGVFARCDIEIASREMYVEERTREGDPIRGGPRKKELHIARP